MTTACCSSDIDRVVEGSSEAHDETNNDGAKKRRCRQIRQNSLAINNSYNLCEPRFASSYGQEVGVCIVVFGGGEVMVADTNDGLN